MLRLAAALPAAVIATAAFAQQELPACPDTISVQDRFEGAAPEGWQAHRRDMPPRLVDIRFYIGHPSEGRAVEPVAGSARGERQWEQAALKLMAKVHRVSLRKAKRAAEA